MENISQQIKAEKLVELCLCLLNIQIMRTYGKAKEDIYAFLTSALVGHVFHYIPVLRNRLKIWQCILKSYKDKAYFILNSEIDKLQTSI
jgi:hypothetical protein